MRRTGMPNGLHAVGYTAADIPQMVAGALQQQRLTKLSPRPCSEARACRAVRGVDAILVVDVAARIGCDEPS